ncbi:Sulfate adenylyltransferase subunit 1 [Pseudomonas sp. 9AZ]|nr:Sulfate adenylyltransferase subunit 1 [Pseudomonas sp. 9AZ]
MLDGYSLRGGLCADLGFTADDRHENLRRAAEVAKLFAEPGLIYIAAFISVSWATALRPGAVDRTDRRTAHLRFGKASRR